MAHKTKIGGTNYEVSGGKTKVGGTNYGIAGGRTKVGGTNYGISFGPPILANFADNPWSTIIWACQNNAVPSTWVVGNQKTMTIDGESFPIDIIGKNHDTYTAGGTAPLTLQMHDCYWEIKPMNSSNTNYQGWEGSAMRKTHLPNILALMPSEVQDGIREVNKLTSAGNQSTTINTTADKLFLLSEIEARGKYSGSIEGEGSQYAYYSSGNSLVKTLDGEDAAWWERSPAKDRNTAFCFVSPTGMAGNLASGAGVGKGVAFAFCF